MEGTAAGFTGVGAVPWRVCGVAQGTSDLTLAERVEVAGWGLYAEQQQEQWQLQQQL